MPGPRHQCPRRGCRVQVDYEELACTRDWYSLPKPIRDAVTRTYNRGLGLGTPEHNAAVKTAIKTMNRHGN
jgi:hypothetical protein